MSFPRFEKLAPDKRTRILNVAAQEFATKGFEKASLNYILERAQMSKGAAYYYFDDKANLYCTVIQYCIERLHFIDTDLQSDMLTADTFWSTFALMHRQPILRSLDQPWLFAALRSAGHLSSVALESEPLASLARDFKTQIMTIVQHGQHLGVVRNDLPDDLIFDWLHALDNASDQWLLKYWDQLDEAKITLISDQTVNAMQRALLPVPPSGSEDPDISRLK